MNNIKTGIHFNEIKQLWYCVLNDVVLGFFNTKDEAYNYYNIEFRKKHYA